MKGQISQLVALASAANGVLFGCPVPTSLYPSNSSFKFCNSVRFVDLKKGFLGKVREVERHGDPNDWLRSLKPTRTIQVWLTYKPSGQQPAPDHQLAAFVGGGGEWQLVVSRKESAEVWISRWEVSHHDAPDALVWRVTYGCVAKLPSPPLIPQPHLELAASRLLASLHGAHEFATAHKLTFWADWFQRAIDCLDSSKPAVFPDYEEFVCRDWYPEIAQRLLAAAYNSWVFGGMGSWNDMGFESDGENARYSTVSKELYSAITDAVQQATWSFRSSNAA